MRLLLQASLLILFLISPVFGADRCEHYIGEERTQFTLALGPLFPYWTGVS